MKYCKYCGSSLPESARICPICKSEDPFDEEKKSSGKKSGRRSESDRQLRLFEKQRQAEEKAEKKAEKKAAAERAKEDRRREKAERALAKAAAKKATDGIADNTSANHNEVNAPALDSAEAVSTEFPAEKTTLAVKSESQEEAVVSENKAENFCDAETKTDSDFSLTDIKESRNAERGKGDGVSVSENEKTSGPKRPQTKLFERLSAITAFAASVIAFALLSFIGVSLVCKGSIRTVDPEFFSFFSSHNLSYYLKTMSEAEIMNVISSSGQYSTEAMIKSMRFLSIAETVVAVVTIVGVCGSFILSVCQFARSLKRGTSPANVSGAVSAAAFYVCGAVMLKSLDYGSFSVVMKNRVQTLATFDLSLAHNLPTIIGIVVLLLLLAATVVLLFFSNFSKEISDKTAAPVKGEKKYRAKCFKEWGLTFSAVALAFVAIFLSGITSITVTTGETADLYVKGENGYQSVECSREVRQSLTLAMMIRQYTVREEEILYRIENNEAQLESDKNNLSLIMENENLNKELEDNKNLLVSMLNLGMTFSVANLAFILMSGAFIVYEICFRRRNYGDSAVVIGVIPAVFALISFGTLIFILSSFSRMQIAVINVAPIFVLLLAAAVSLLSFFTRKECQKNQ